MQYYQNAIKSSVIQALQRAKNADFRLTYELYDKLTGLDRVRTAHESVAAAESNFVQQQIQRRARQLEVFKLEEAKNRIDVQLDTVKRSDENFLKLVTELHEVSRRYNEAREQLSSVELAEQVAFEQFSSTLRHSQAEERIQANRMRQWTLGFSVAAGLFGFGATWLRFRQLSNHSQPLLIASDLNSKSLLSSLNTTLKSSDEALKQTIINLDYMKSHLDESMQLLKQDLDSVNLTLKKIVSNPRDSPSDPIPASTDSILFIGSILTVSGVVAGLLLFLMDR